MGQLLAFPVDRAAPRIVFGRALLLRLLDRASEITTLPVDEIRSQTRRRDITWTRFAIMAAAHERGKSYRQMGLFFGHVDHTSARHGVQRAYDIAGWDRDYGNLLRLLREEAAR